MTTAERLAGAMYVAENGSICIRGDHPDADTVRKMVYRAEESGLGHDFAYEAVRDALVFIDDVLGEPDQDTIYENDFEFADAQTDVYTGRLVNWLAQAPAAHLALCDESVGVAALSPDATIESRIQNGQFYGYMLAMQSVGNNWPDPENTDESETE